MLRVVSVREHGTRVLKPEASHKAEGDPYLEVNRTPGTEPETRVTLVRCRR